MKRLIFLTYIFVGIVVGLAICYLAIVMSSEWRSGVYSVISLFTAPGAAIAFYKRSTTFGTYLAIAMTVVAIILDIVLFVTTYSMESNAFTSLLIISPRFFYPWLILMLCWQGALGYVVGKFLLPPEDNDNY